ncbi:MAG: hypothetical protein O3A46_02430, partial [Candidatus Poribacteria bacterium]|nr:hypothetical protein [Candidatus Poribacteria bacterium]
AQRLFDSSDPETRRYARIIFALATRNAESLVKTPREGLEVTLKARLCASEVSDSALIGQVDWRPLFARFADGLVAEVEDSSRRLPQDRIEEASSARDLLKRVYELTKIDSVIPSIVKITIFQARSLVTLGRKAVLPTDNTYFGEYDAEALDLLHETLSLAPDHVLLQQETAQLRLRRGLVAAERGRLNEALIDFARAHELDPVSHRIATTYANFMMEQANRMWMDPRPESQREALSLAYRVLSTNPADAQLLSRCSRFLDLPDAHELRSTPEYRRLATLFLRYAHDGSHE